LEDKAARDEADAAWLEAKTFFEEEEEIFN